MKTRYQITYIIFLLLLISFPIVSQHRNMINIPYPFVKTSAVVEKFYGKEISDPYRILENINDSSSKKWYEEQKVFYNSVTKKITNRNIIKQKIEKYIFATNVNTDVPRVAGNRIFYLRSYIKENIQKIFYRDSPDLKEVEIFSTEPLNSDNNNHHLDYFQPSYDGKHLVLGISLNGDEMSVIRILNVQTKALLNDSIERAMYGNPQWLKDGSGFFYGQLKEVKNEEDKNTMFESMKIKLHYLGKNVKEDKEVFSQEFNPSLKLEGLDFPLLYLNPTSDKAIVSVSYGSSFYLKLYCTDLKDLLNNNASTAKWNKITSPEDQIIDFVLNHENLYVIRKKNNPLGVLEKLNIDRPQERAIVYNSKQYILEGLILNKKALYVKYSVNGIFNLLEVDLNTNGVNTIDTELKGTIEFNPTYAIGINYTHSNYLFMRISSWNKDWSIYYYDSEKKKLVKTNINPKGDFSEAPQLIVKELEVPSWDGAMVPLTIIHSKNIKLNGSNPTMLEGYGAYGLSKNPSFKLPLLAWFDEGGIFAVAHVRGGGEKGEDWYKGGFKATKPNSWKDYIACAEFLIKNKYTSSATISAIGGSAGGITIGRAITERPELFKAAIISYGALNTVRDEFSGNNFGISEFGTIKDSLEFQYLYEMDVYHHIEKNVQYPSILFTTAMNDPRVAFWIPAKAAAKMQSVSTGKNNVILLRISGQGHWGDSSVADETADKYSFLLWQLGHPDYQFLEKQ